MPPTLPQFEVQLPPEASNHAAVAEPLGFTVPFNVAEVVVIAEAETAERIGAEGEATGRVVKLIVELCTGPPEFKASIWNE
jgi:hypothetical protein